MVEITTVTAIVAMIISVVAAFRQTGKDSAQRAREMGEITVALRDIDRNLTELKERVNRLENRLEAENHQ